MKTTTLWKVLTAAMMLMILISSCKKDKAETLPANEVFIQGSAFTPGILTVAAGTTVKWTNKDNSTHTVTSNTSVFNSGNLAKSGTFSFTFNTTGSFPYHCSIHPGMTGTIVVQ